MHTRCGVHPKKKVKAFRTARRRRRAGQVSMMPERGQHRAGGRRGDRHVEAARIANPSSCNEDGDPLLVLTSGEQPGPRLDHGPSVAPC